MSTTRTIPTTRVESKARRDHARPLTLADAHAVLASCGVVMTPGRVRKLLKAYRRCNQGQDFGRYVTAGLEADRRVVTYADPTGEDAVYTVMGGTR